MKDGDRYVVGSQNTLYRISNTSCSEGDSVILQSQTVERFFNVNGRWVKSDDLVLGNYSNYSYTCHIWSDSQSLDINSLILPATLIVLCFFYIVYKWFIRLRG